MIIPIAFDEIKNNHIKPEEISYDKMIQRSILNKVDVIFKALKWESPALFPKKVRKTKNTSTIPLNQARIENKGSLDPKEDKGVDNVKKEKIKPFWEESDYTPSLEKTIKLVKPKESDIAKLSIGDELETFYEE